MIVADENIDLRIIQALRSNKIDIVSVFEKYRGISDEEVIALACKMHRILLTEDKDFGEWVYAHNVKDLSVVFLRYKFNDTAKIIEILLNLFADGGDKLKGSFTTVTINKIRIRGL